MTNSNQESVENLLSLDSTEFDKLIRQKIPMPKFAENLARCPICGTVSYTIDGDGNCPKPTCKNELKGIRLDEDGDAKIVEQYTGTPTTYSNKKERTHSDNFRDQSKKFDGMSKDEQNRLTEKLRKLTLLRVHGGKFLNKAEQKKVENELNDLMEIGKPGTKNQPQKPLVDKTENS